MQLVETLTQIGGGIASMFASVINTLSTVFFTIPETGGVELTAIGYIALISLVLSIVWALFRFVTGLVKAKGR